MGFKEEIINGKTLFSYVIGTEKGRKRVDIL